MQVEAGHSLDAQPTMLTDYVRAKDWIPVDIPSLASTLGHFRVDYREP